MDKLQQSMMHGPCDATPTVTFPAVRHHRPLSLISNKLYCLVREAYVCEQLAYGRLRGPAVEHWSLADVLSLSCARLVDDG